MMGWLGLDIGGANLKASDGADFAVSRSFRLWQHPERLAQELRSLIAEAPPSDHLAATMTGELADCFESKQQGVAAILASLEEAADGRHTRVYLTDGRFVTPHVARRQYPLAASANWHALARFAARFVPEGHRGLLIDVGSTTTDLIPLSSSGPVARGSNDLERLLAGELIYTGVRRSPICAVLAQATYRGQPLPVAQELFATMLDAYLILGEIAEDASQRDTADGRPATKRNARQRLARCLCADHEQFHHRDAICLSLAAQDGQIALLARSLAQRHAGEGRMPQVIVSSGDGEFLARSVINQLRWTTPVVSLRKRLAPAASRCATAYALAALAAEDAGPEPTGS